VKFCKTIFETKWIKLKETERGFQFLERRGVDSIAILLVRLNEGGFIEALIRKQPLWVNGTDDDLFACPITGSIEEEETARESAIREAFEEAGYVVDNSEVLDLGSYISATMMNETVHMFVADVTGKENVPPTGDGGYHESISHNDWEGWDSVMTAEFAGLLMFSTSAREEEIHEWLKDRHPENYITDVETSS
jgi:8-oxo-dGTP diphosphatase